MIEEYNEVVPQAEETTQPAAAPAPVETPQPQPTFQQQNFRNMRERAERAERELEAVKSSRTRAQEEPIQDEDGLVERKDLRKYDKMASEQQEILNKTKKELEAIRANTIEFQLRTKYTDLDRVVNPENLEKLARLKPALYKSIVSNPDLGDQIESAYEVINTYVQPGKYDAQDKKLEENRSKPRNASSIAPQASDSPLARAGDYDRRILSNERKAELLREMEEAQANY